MPINPMRDIKPITDERADEESELRILLTDIALDERSPVLY